MRNLSAFEYSRLTTLTGIILGVRDRLRLPRQNVDRTDLVKHVDVRRSDRPAERGVVTGCQKANDAGREQIRTREARSRERAALTADAHHYLAI